MKYTHALRIWFKIRLESILDVMIRVNMTNENAQAIIIGLLLQNGSLCIDKHGIRCQQRCRHHHHRR